MVVLLPPPEPPVVANGNSVDEYDNKLGVIVNTPFPPLPPPPAPPATLPKTPPANIDPPAKLLALFPAPPPPPQSGNECYPVAVHQTTQRL